MTKIVYIDMDGVMCDYSVAYAAAKADRPDIDFPQSVPGFFLNLNPIEGAVAAVETLRGMCDAYVLTAPSTRNPHCYSEKRIWIENHFGYEFTKKLIISPNKSLLIGDFLIDDHDQGRGQESFSGKLLHFGSPDFPDWNAVLQHLRL